MTTIRRQNQRLPEEHAEYLRSLYRNARVAKRDSNGRASTASRAAWCQFTGYAHLLQNAGWTVTAAAGAVGMSRQGLSDLFGKYPPAEHAGGPPVPPPPTQPEKRPRPQPGPRPQLPEDVRRELVRLRTISIQVSGPIRGTAREGEPAWQASVAFAAMVHNLTTEEGYSLKQIARATGVTLRAITTRLARQGYPRRVS